MAVAYCFRTHLLVGQMQESDEGQGHGQVIGHGAGQPGTGNEQKT